MYEQERIVESPPRLPHEQQLLAALTYGDEEAAARQAEFRAAVDEYTAGRTQTEQMFIRTAAARDEVYLFGQSGEQLPPGLSLSLGDDGNYRVDFSDRYGFESETEGQTAMYGYSCFKQFDAHYVESLRLKRPEITAAIAALLRDSPQYAFLRSFQVGTIQMEYHGLTQIQRLMAERGIERAVRQKYGVEGDLGSRITADDGEMERIALARGEESSRKFWLDSTASQPRRRPRGDDSAGRFNSWFLEYLGSTGAAEKYTEVIRNAHGRLAARTPQGRECEFESIHWRQALQNISPRDKHVTAEWALTLAPDFVREFYAQPSVNMEQLLESLVDQCASKMFESLIAHESERRSVLDTLRRPIGTVLEHSAYYVAGNDPLGAPLNATHVFGRDELEADRGREAATILYCSDALQGRSRLIGSRLLACAYPSSADRYDLALRFSDDPSVAEYAYENGREPRIPGLTVLAREGTTWYFRKDEVDPYDGSDKVAVSAYRAEGLAFEYKKLGMMALATDAAICDNVAQLVLSVGANNDYTFDTSLPSLQTRFLHDFAPYVRDGRLQAQCTIAAAFLIASMRPIVVAGDQLSAISGLVLYPWKQTVDAHKHMQVRFSHTERKCLEYILDASVPLQEIGTDGRIFDQPRNGKRTEPRPVAEPASDKAGRNPVSEKYSHYATVTVADVRAQLEESLKQPLGTSDVWTAVSRLRAGDPIQKALGALLDAESGDSTRLLATLSYVHSCASADPSTMRILQQEYGIHQYNTMQLGIVETALRRAVEIVSVSAPPDS